MEIEAVVGVRTRVVEAGACSEECIYTSDFAHEPLRRCLDFE
jgi:hypothetical protein